MDVLTLIHLAYVILFELEYLALVASAFLPIEEFETAYPEEAKVRRSRKDHMSFLRQVEITGSGSVTWRPSQGRYRPASGKTSLGLEDIRSYLHIPGRRRKLGEGLSEPRHLSNPWE